jgi:hypothetical protein
LNNPNAFRWADTIQLKGNLRLVVKDVVIFLPDGNMSSRDFSYDLRDSRTNRLIWRICNHGCLRPVDDPCHVHANPDDEDERIECFDDSRKTTFDYVMHCLKLHFEGKSQEWERLHADE